MIIKKKKIKKKLTRTEELAQWLRLLAVVTTEPNSVLSTHSRLLPTDLGLCCPLLASIITACLCSYNHTGIHTELKKQYKSLKKKQAHSHLLLFS